MAAIEQVFVYNFGSSKARHSNLVLIPPEIDTPDTPDPSILRFNVILDEKSNKQYAFDYHNHQEGHQNLVSTSFRWRIMANCVSAVDSRHR